MNETVIPKPSWLRVSLPSGESYGRIKALMSRKSLHTVCEEAMCPNMAECWGCGTATFLILGNICTRSCGFCAVRTGRPGDDPTGVSQALDVADAVETMRLKHAVITSVTRDDLPDGGASLFAETISRIHDQVQGCTVEVLIPDFKGNAHSLKLVTEARPEILAHNLETIPRLYPSVRPQADYRRSLKLLQSTRYHDSNVLTKSGIMVGLGENTEELLRVFADLRLSGCDILTVGQYLRPTRKHLPVVRYYTPEEFLGIREAAYEAGFRWVESGPLVRSSYHAGKPARELRQELDHKRP